MTKHFSLLTLSVNFINFAKAQEIIPTAWTYDDGDSADYLAPKIDLDAPVTYADFYHLKEKLYGGGFRDACPVLEDDLGQTNENLGNVMTGRKKRQTVDLGFTDDDCLFPKIKQVLFIMLEMRSCPLIWPEICVRIILQMATI